MVHAASNLDDLYLRESLHFYRPAISLFVRSCVTLSFRGDHVALSRNIATLAEVGLTPNVYFAFFSDGQGMVVRASHIPDWKPVSLQVLFTLKYVDLLWF